ncbi:MAG: hypothetical protein K2X93_15970 [Candidatus Obscuribacterales bacterium]|nr:hypothetical protein [Candidatus Obscuribacterales bacterium]
MKLKPVLPIALCAVTLLVTATLPATAANSTTGASAARSNRPAWPKWYYYDYIGMREWHKGNKSQGLAYLDQSYKLAQAACGSGRAPLDNYTKKLLGDVIEHQTLHIADWREVPREKAQNLSVKELLKRESRGIPQSEKERQWRFLEKLTKFAGGTLGKRHYVVQRLEAQMEDCIPAPTQEDSQAVAAGNPMRGRVNGQTPKWWREADSDLRPELFTRERRNLHGSTKKNENKLDPASEPTIAGKGFVYIAGQKYDRNKQDLPHNNGWGGNSLVGAAAKDPKDPNNEVYSGWGNQGQGAEMRAVPITKWGMSGEEKVRGGLRTPTTPWGQNTKDFNGTDTGNLNSWGDSAGVGQDPERSSNQQSTYSSGSK